jgi:23S rRNA pseudouridine1911/1915/1917 synthase
MVYEDYRVRPVPLPELEEAADDGDAAAESTEQRSTLIEPGQHGLRLDKALVALAPEFSRTHLQDLVADGHVSVDGQVARQSSRKVLAGQRLVVELVPTAESRAFRPEPMTLQVVFEDAHLMVIDKPAGLVVHPAAGNWQGTLLNGLLAWHAAAATLPRAGIVHRLDKDTSGLMVVGKTLAAVTALTRAIGAREVHRQYLALAHGAWPAGLTRVDAAVGRDPRSRIRMTVLASGRAARTDVERIAFDAALIEGGVSAVRCTLHSGRTHQIRVHLSARGHPLLGDTLYGGRPVLGLARQALHATRLAFAHPASGAALAFDAALPADLAPVWNRVAVTPD